MHYGESLLAKSVLSGNTKGYRNHPQLIRFKDTQHPVESIDCYLKHIFNESLLRGYHFNKEKINWNVKDILINVSDKQLKFEKHHLLKKLKSRNVDKYKEISNIAVFDSNPMFCVVNGEIEAWEIIK